MIYIGTIKKFFDKKFFWGVEALPGHNLRERKGRLVFLYRDDLVEVLNPRSSDF